MPADWDRLQELFGEVVGLSPDERILRLALIAERDPELHAELLSLLDADERAGELLGRIEATGSIVSPPSETETGEDDPAERDLLPRLERALQGRYRIERRVGRGGMAIVYLAQDLKHERPVALKVLRPEVAASLGTERFLQEIKIAARLNHPNILPLHDSGDADGLLFFVMPFVEGESLRERLERDGTLSEEEAVRIAREIAGPLEYAHDLGVVHRDIKPGNILLSGGHAVISDFGIALALSAAEATRFTETGLSLGTPAYMSPEQVGLLEDVDGRSDVYSLGCVLYEMLTGEPPFGSISAQRMLTAHLTDAPPDLREVRLEISASLPPVVERALAKAPSDRFQTAEEFGDALAATQAAETAASREATGGLRGIRGSLWQVFALYVVFGWVVFQVSEALATPLGLPLWFSTATIILLALGLPVLLTTAFAQSKSTAAGEAAREWKRPLRILTWRRALLGGVAAFSLLAAATAGYVGMRNLGIGPPATLIARGTLDADSEILLADFAGAPEDSLLARTATAALRIDLAQSPVFRLASRGQVRRALRRMQRDPAERTELEVAREVAVREGMAAVIGGEVVRAGERYLFTAELVEAASGQPLATVQAAADSSEAVVAAIDRLSKQLRERIGEPLRSLRTAPPLPAVTTSSLEALQKYVEGFNMPERARGIALLEEAVALDTAFAIAWRRLGAFLAAQGSDWSKALHAVTQAFEHRDALTRDERLLVEGTYYFFVGEYKAAIAANEELLTLPPDERRLSGELNFDRVGFIARANNALSYLLLRRHEEAYEILLEQRRDDLPARCGSNYALISNAQVDLGKLEEARKDSEDCPYLFPLQVEQQGWAGRIAGAVGDAAAAEMRYQAVRDARGEEVRWRAEASRGLARVASVRGKLAEAEAHARDAMDAERARELPGAHLSLAAETAERDLLVRRDTLRALRGLELALAEVPLEDLHPLDAPYLEFASLYAQAGQPRVARTLLDAFEESVEPRYRNHDREAPYHRARGEIALSEGRNEDAVAEFRASDVGRCLICALPGLARAYEAAGTEDSVLAVLERYVATPNYLRLQVDQVHLAPTLERLGELYEARGRIEEASMCYARLVDLWADADAELQERVQAARARVGVGGTPAAGCGFPPPQSVPRGFDGLAVTDSAGCHTVRGSISETNWLGTIEGDLQGTTFTLVGHATESGAEWHTPVVHTFSITGGTVSELVGRDLKLWGHHVSLMEPKPGAVVDFNSRLRVRYPGRGELTVQHTLDGTNFPPILQDAYQYSGVICP
jgi:tetratricopeptide (TPR) repeat protein